MSSIKIYVSVRGAAPVQLKKKLSRIPSKLAIWAIVAYKHSLSLVLHRLGIECRFYPDCANYSRQCFEKYGFRQGVTKTYRRLRRCNPECWDSCIDLP